MPIYETPADQRPAAGAPPVSREGRRCAPPFPARALLLLLLPGVVVACGGRGAGSAPPDPSIDAEQVALNLERTTRLERPARLVFEWNIRESGMRLQGRGVARVEPPYRARLDLFTGSGETVVRAALVGDELRLPVDAPPGLIPPAPLLWASLGVFRAGARLSVLGARELDDGVFLIRLRHPEGGELRYRVRDRAILDAERVRDGHVVERVEVEPGDGPFPREARYRNLADFRELTVRLEEMDFVESYPPDIWDPGR